MINNVFLFLEQFAALLILVLISVFAVGFLFFGKEAQEFTPSIKGRITKNDTPIKNANVVLTIRSENRSFERSFTTNTNGEFKFDPVFRKRNKVLSIFDGLFQTICSVEVTTTV
ncbi:MULTISPECIES: carboxypeptidase-like regulatory domain-containing protein, partial [Vibrio]